MYIIFICINITLISLTQTDWVIGWLGGSSVVERRSLTGELSLVHAADG